MSRSVYVGNLPYRVTQEEVRDIFSRDGLQVASVNLIMDRETGKPRGFGFVEMATEQAAEDAVRAFDGYMMNGRPLKVSIARPKDAAGGGGPPFERRPPREGGYERREGGGGYNREGGGGGYERREGGYNREGGGGGYNREGGGGGYNREGGGGGYNREGGGGGYNREGGGGGYNREGGGGYNRDGGPPRPGGYNRDGGPPRPGGFNRDGGPPRPGGFNRDGGPPRPGGFNREGGGGPGRRPWENSQAPGWGDRWGPPAPATQKRRQVRRKDTEDEERAIKAVDHKKNRQWRYEEDDDFSEEGKEARLLEGMDDGGDGGETDEG